MDGDTTTAIFDFLLRFCAQELGTIFGTVNSFYAKTPNGVHSLQRRGRCLPDDVGRLPDAAGKHGRRPEVKAGTLNTAGS